MLAGAGAGAAAAGAAEPIATKTTSSRSLRARVFASLGSTSGARAPGVSLFTRVAGAREPLVEPSDAKARARNERLDVVFVATGSPAASK